MACRYDGLSEVVPDVTDGGEDEDDDGGGGCRCSYVIGRPFDMSIVVIGCWRRCWLLPMRLIGDWD